MANTVAGVNGEVLRWARERAAYSVEEVAKRMKKDAAVIEAWESGASLPTYVQLETLAYKVYRRPLALFFFPSPPSEPDAKESFRTVPDHEIDGLLPDTRFAVRQVRAMQIALRELTDSLNPAARKIFRDLRFTGREDTTEASCAIRTYLGVQLDEQTSWSTVEVGWRRWRQVVEDVGVFVFKRSLRQRDVSGFCISDAEFPVICVNNSASVTRQVFTLFHELSHVLMQTNGITLRDDRYIEHLPHQAKRAEVFCNALAAETLVPSRDFARFIVAGPWSDEAIGSVADRYKVSREVILRRLADAGQVSTNEYVRRREVNRPGFSGGCVT